MLNFSRRLKNRFLKIVQKTSISELAAGNEHTAAACAEIARAIESVRMPSWHECKGNGDSRRRRK